MAEKTKFTLELTQDQFDHLLYALDTRMDTLWARWHTFERLEQPEMASENRHACQEVGNLKRHLVARHLSGEEATK